MTHKSDAEILKQHHQDWYFLGESLRIGTRAEIDQWALRWSPVSGVDPAFVIHNGVLKTFSWFIVDRQAAKLRDRAFAKGQVFDVLELNLLLDADKCLRREACASVDWGRLRGEIDAQLKKFEVPNQ